MGRFKSLFAKPGHRAAYPYSKISPYVRFSSNNVALNCC